MPYEESFWLLKFLIKHDLKSDKSILKSSKNVEYLFILNKVLEKPSPMKYSRFERILFKKIISQYIKLVKSQKNLKGKNIAKELYLVELLSESEFFEGLISEDFRYFLNQYR